MYVCTTIEESDKSRIERKVSKLVRAALVPEATVSQVTITTITFIMHHHTCLTFPNTFASASIVLFSWRFHKFRPEGKHHSIRRRGDHGRHLSIQFELESKPFYHESFVVISGDGERVRWCIERLPTQQFQQPNDDFLDPHDHHQHFFCTYPSSCH